MIVYDRPVLMDYLHGDGGTKCSTLHDAAWLSIVPDVWLMAMRTADAQFGMQLAAALADVKNTKAYVDQQVEFFHLSKECGDGAPNDTDPIGLESMGGSERTMETPERLLPLLLSCRPQLLPCSAAACTDPKLSHASLCRSVHHLRRAVHARCGDCNRAEAPRQQRMQLHRPWQGRRDGGGDGSHRNGWRNAASDHGQRATA